MRHQEHIQKATKIRRLILEAIQVIQGHSIERSSFADVSWTNEKASRKSNYVMINPIYFIIFTGNLKAFQARTAAIS